MLIQQKNNFVIALSGAGVFFILMGLLALALPTPQEGAYLFQIGPDHSLYMMDVVGVFTIGLGILLTWLGGKMWKRQITP